MITKKLTLSTLVTICILPLWCYSAETFINFDDIPATDKNTAPASGSSWRYGSNHIKDGEISIVNCGWWKYQGYQDNPTIHNYVRYYVNEYNSTHMGFTTYGFIEIDSSNIVKGNSLRITTTGGITTLDNDVTTKIYGLDVRNKEDYLEYLVKNQDPIGLTPRTVGHPYIYFGNTDSVQPYAVIPEASEATRMSLYIYMPEGLNNGLGGAGKPPEATANLGPYNDIGGHWYHNVYNRGGGWTHIVVDSHPQHNNAWSNASAYPYPSSSMRAMGTPYFNSLYRWYITLKPYTGVGTPPYYTWIDEIEFIHDSEDQNDETIASPAITYYPLNKNFEIGFSDKYKNLSHSNSTYEMRYSFSQITNINWGSATPVTILADPRFGITQSDIGIFKKWWPYYQNVWAPFKLKAIDEDKLTDGLTIYFAIKDVSQNPDNLSTINPKYNKGRPYSSYPTAYDYDGDKIALPLIKRIDYYIGTKYIPKTSDNSPTIKSIKIYQ